MSGAPGWIRTSICRFRRSVPFPLEPLELGDHAPTLPSPACGQGNRILLGRRAETPYLPLQGGGRQHLLRFEANAVGWGSGPWRALLLIIAVRELTPTRLPPIKSGVADLPLSGRGIAELAAPLSPYAIALRVRGRVGWGRRRRFCRALPDHLGSWSIGSPSRDRTRDIRFQERRTAAELRRPLP
jgi:hypothetical protein